jgi:hypothetical protein
MHYISGRGLPIKAAILPLIAAPIAAAAIAIPPTANAVVNFDFHSPSGNIYCDMRMDDDGKSQTTCMTADRNWVSPPRSSNCLADERWGDALSLYQGKAGFQCYTRLPDEPTSAAESPMTVEGSAEQTRRPPTRRLFGGVCVFSR